MKIFSSQNAFLPEAGGELPVLEIAYHTYGTLNAEKDNVIWICHALTASSDAALWWQGLVGEGCAFDTKKYFVVCANILGSSYGTTGPLSKNPKNGQPYYQDFPVITIRDMVRAHQLLARHLGIKKIAVLAGGSMGGYQALEWAVMEPAFIDKLFLIATSARETPWGIAIHTSQRLAIEADSTWGQRTAGAGSNGLKAARAFGMITYRSYTGYLKTQTDADVNKLDDFRASSYIHYQGEKLVKRFNAFSYLLLTKAMDSHNLSRGRNKTLEEILAGLPQQTLIIGITSDLLCPLEEQQLLADNIPCSTLIKIDSDFGHDGFLVETKQITAALNQWLNK